MPTGKVKWYDSDKGFGFLTSDDGEDIFVHQSALPADVTGLKGGQRVEFGIAEGRRGLQALQVRVVDAPRSVVKGQRKKPDEMVVIVEDLIKLLDDLSGSYRRGKHPDSKEARKVAHVLRALASDLEA